MTLFYPILFFGIFILILLIFFYIKSIQLNKKIKKDPYYGENKKKE